MVLTCHAGASLAVAAFFYRKYRQDGKIMACVLAGGACLGGVLLPDLPVALKIVFLKILKISPESWSATMESQAHNVMSSFFVWACLILIVGFLEKRVKNPIRYSEVYRQGQVLAWSGFLHVFLDSLSHGNAGYMRKLSRQYFWPLPFDLGSSLTQAINLLSGSYQYVPLSDKNLAILLPGDFFGYAFTACLVVLASGFILWPRHSVFYLRQF